MVEAFLGSLAALFVFGTFWFWMLVVIVALVIATEVHFDKGTPATFTLIGTVVFLHFFSGVSIFQYAFHNLGWFLGGAVLYLLIGACLYSPAKLALHTKNLSDRYRREQVQFLRTNKFPDEADFKTLAPELRQRWQEYVENRLLMDIDQRDGSVTFDLHKRRATVIMWIGHWPFSLLGTLLNDPVRRAINFLYERMTVFYEKIIAQNLGNTKGHILTHDEEKDLRAAAVAAANSHRNR